VTAATEPVQLARSQGVEESDAPAWKSPRDGSDSADAASFVVELTHFSGPLDLLLTLLREEQIDIYDIPIARIAEQFLDRIQSLRLDEAAEYLEMAARLLRIKAQLLLPRHDGDEAWDDPRAELVRHLLEYQQVREVVDVLDARAELRRSRFAHPPAPVVVRPTVPARLSVALVDLLAAVDRVLRLASGPTVHSIVPRALDVAGAVLAARALLSRRGRLRWTELVPSGAEAWHVLSVLLALLELARLGECLIRQPVAFGPVEADATERPVPAMPATVGDAADSMSEPSPSEGEPPATSDSPVTSFETPHDTTGAAA
jgi:segregation and condensation protein A